MHRSEAVEAQAIQALADAVRVHSEESGVVHVACMALSSLCTEQDAGCDGRRYLAAEAGVFQSMLAVMQRWPQHVGVQKSGRTVIRAIAVPSLLMTQPGPR